MEALCSITNRFPCPAFASPTPSSLRPPSSPTTFTTSSFHCPVSLPPSIFAPAPQLPQASTRHAAPYSSTSHLLPWQPNVVHSLLLALVLQWLVELHTSRSLIMGFLRTHAGLLFDRRPPPLPSPQLTTKTRLSKFTRRVVFLTPFVGTTTTAFVSLAAGAPTDKYDPRRSFLQNLGIGDADIYYPRLFEGSWVCDSTLVAVDTPQGEEKADKKSVEFSRKQLGYTVTYKARFIPFGKNVIADRLFTTLSLVESTMGKSAVDHGIWGPDKPDRLTLVLRGGVKVQNFVTKRSSSLSGPDQFDTSEYSQQIFDNPKFEGGPPIIKASQNRTRYQWDSNAIEVSTIEAFQKISMFPVIEEGLQNIDIMGMDKPVTVYKYIVRFTRDNGQTIDN